MGADREQVESRARNDVHSGKKAGDVVAGVRDSCTCTRKGFGDHGRRGDRTRFKHSGRINDMTLGATVNDSSGTG